jgi:CRP-like cAMP-binding protein
MADALATLLAKLRVRDAVSEAEERALRESVAEFRELPAGKIIVRANEPLSHSILLVSGFAHRYKDLADGQRQIMELHVSGDFVDLHGFLLKYIDHHVGAVTDVRLAFVPHEALRRITEEHPHLARLLWLSTLLDAAIHREKILSIGRRIALARIAHMFCELYLRLETVGLAAKDRYLLPLTQADLADACGLTSVHVNRMLKRLRDDNLLTFRGGEVVIHDMAALKRAAEFRVDYLHVDRQPR